jgi:hypothetical protein
MRTQRKAPARDNSFRDTTILPIFLNSNRTHATHHPYYENAYASGVADAEPCQAAQLHENSVP